MTDSPAVLAPGLSLPQQRLLRAMLSRADLPPLTLALDWDDIARISPPTIHVLSVGKAALDLWHPFGLIQVGQNRGNVFTHHDALGRHYLIMVVEHPGSLMQLSITGHQAKDNMARDLQAWRQVIEDPSLALLHRPKLCGGCLKSKRGSYPAHHWDARLNDVGLCDDHFRKRARYRIKKAKKPDPSKAEAQIAGQLEMLPGDGTRVRMPKG